MRVLALLVTGAVIGGSGCVEIRASSRIQLTSKQSSLQFPGTGDEGVKPLLTAFAQRGYPLVDRKAHESGQVYLFKGSRNSVTVTTGNQYGISTSSNVVGSIFYAYVTENPSGGTEAELFGKPTVDGRPVCSDQDRAWSFICSPTVTGALWPGREQATGREEAEVIRGIILELSMNKLATAPAEQEEAAGETSKGKSRCVASELPEWPNASPSRKKELMAGCRAPVAGETAP